MFESELLIYKLGAFVDTKLDILFQVRSFIKFVYFENTSLKNLNKRYKLLVSGLYEPITANNR